MLYFLRYYSSFSSNLWGKHFPKVFLTPFGIAFILLLCVTLTGISIVGCFNLKPMWTLQDNYKKGGSMHQIMVDFLNAEPFYVENELFIITEEFVRNKDTVDRLLQDLNDRPEVVNIRGWYEPYQEYLNNTQSGFPMTNLALSQSLHLWINNNQTNGPYYANDLKFTDDK